MYWAVLLSGVITGAVGMRLLDYLTSNKPKSRDLISESMEGLHVHLISQMIRQMKETTELSQRAKESPPENSAEILNQLLSLLDSHVRENKKYTDAYSSLQNSRTSRGGGTRSLSRNAFNLNETQAVAPHREAMPRCELGESDHEFMPPSTQTTADPLVSNDLATNTQITDPPDTHGAELIPYKPELKEVDWNPMTAVSRKRTALKPYSGIEQYAPYRHDRLPSADQLMRVKCYELGQTGITFVLDSMPDFKFLVVRLSPADSDPVDLTATVVNVYATKGTCLLVQCDFTGKVYL